MSDNILLEARREGSARYSLRTSAAAFAEGAQFALTRLATHSHPFPSPEAEHRPGCDALGGYGHGVGPCTCGASPEAEALPTLPVVAAEYKHKYDGFRYVSNAVAFETLPEARELTYRDTAEAAIVALRAERDEAYSARDAAINLANSRFDSMRAAQAEVAELRKDAQRLDWIERKVCDVSRLGDAARTLRIYWNNGADSVFVGPGYSATWREAIDTARASLLGDGGTL